MFQFQEVQLKDRDLSASAPLFYVSIPRGAVKRPIKRNCEGGRSKVSIPRGAVKSD